MKNKVFIKHELKKKDFYKWLKQTLEDNGWENISSKPSTDFDVFYSKGESGNDELYFQMKEYAASSVNSTLSGSSERFFDVKPLKGYTPGAPGNPGVLDRSDESFIRLQISIGEIQMNSDMTVHYNVNKNRIIIVTEFPITINEDSVIFMIGKPDEHLSKYYSNGSMIVFSSTSYNRIASGLEEADSTNKAAYSLNTIELMMPKVKNSSGVNFMSELAVGNNSEGIKALIEGVYVLTGDFNLNKSCRGDLLVDQNNNKYQIFYLGTRTSSSYQYYEKTRYIALMIERGELDG